MAIMTHNGSKATRPRLVNTDGADLPRAQLKLALELADTAKGDLTDRIAEAAATVGADLLFMLPAPDGSGPSAMVHLADETGDRFLQVQPAAEGMAVSEGDEVNPHFLSLARTSVDVLRKIGDDPDVRALAKAN